MQIAFAMQVAFAHSDQGGSGQVSVSVHYSQLSCRNQYPAKTAPIERSHYIYYIDYTIFPVPLQRIDIWFNLLRSRSLCYDPSIIKYIYSATHTWHRSRNIEHGVLGGKIHVIQNMVFYSGRCYTATFLQRVNRRNKVYQLECLKRFLKIVSQDVKSKQLYLIICLKQVCKNNCDLMI